MVRKLPETMQVNRKMSGSTMYPFNLIPAVNIKFLKNETIAGRKHLHFV